jgi:very-short-patch-repair endonuclease
MIGTEDLAEAIAVALSAAFKAYDIARAVTELGLPVDVDDDPSRSKRLFVKKKILFLPRAELIELGDRVVEMVDALELREILDLAREESMRVITTITRSKILDYLATHGPLEGKRDIVEFSASVFPIGDPSPTIWKGFNPSNMADQIWQHMVNNPNDWDYRALLDNLGARACSQRRLFSLLEQAVHPLTRDGDDQQRYVADLNSILRPDDFELRSLEEQSGHPIYGVMRRDTGVHGGVKNLIFAADGPKPDLILSDALTNNIAIVRNAEFCLVFDQPIPQHGLTWQQLVHWYASLEGLDATARETTVLLYQRLKRSLGSEPERRMFHRYFRTWKKVMKEKLPALIPQVYLHYDPLTIRQRAANGVLRRQRMDFLILFSPHERVVIEVDGKQHYSVGDVASPSQYANMVAADRDLRLLGYEIYRFGGAELSGSGCDAIIDKFFRRLFERHGCLPQNP